jgi:hypothetical protein
MSLLIGALYAATPLELMILINPYPYKMWMVCLIKIEK